MSPWGIFGSSEDPKSPRTVPQDRKDTVLHTNDFQPFSATLANISPVSTFDNYFGLGTAGTGRRHKLCI
jgi:hypothetical protein